MSDEPELAREEPEVARDEPELALEALEASGGMGFDPVRVRLAARLLEAARALGTPGARLRARAAALLVEVKREHDAARDGADGAMAALEDAPAWLVALHARGDTGASRRWAARRLREIARARRRCALAELPRGSRSDPSATARALAAIERAEATLPVDAGPYNTEVVAHRALATLAALSPEYLTAYVAHLAEVDAALAAVEPPPRAARRGRPGRV